MDNDFPNDFIRKIFVKILVECKGLYPCLCVLTVGNRDIQKSKHTLDAIGQGHARTPEHSRVEGPIQNYYGVGCEKTSTPEHFSNPRTKI